MAMTPIDALTHQAKSQPEHAAFIFHDDAWTYRRLADEATRVAHGLVAAGIKAGDRVALHMMNRPEMLIAYFACLRLGAIAAPLRTAFKFAELAPILQRLAPAPYIGESELYRNVAAVDAGILPRQRRVLVGALDDHDGAQPWDVLKRSEQAALLKPPPYVSAVLINTSARLASQNSSRTRPTRSGATTDILCTSRRCGNTEITISVAAVRRNNCALTM